MWIDARLPLPNGTYAATGRGALRTFCLLTLCALAGTGLAVASVAASPTHAPGAATWVFGSLAVLFAAAAALASRAAFPRRLTVDESGLRGRGVEVSWVDVGRVDLHRRVFLERPGQPQWGLRGSVRTWPGLVLFTRQGRVAARLLGTDWPEEFLPALAVRAAQRGVAGAGACAVREETAMLGVARFLLRGRGRARD